MLRYDRRLMLLKELGVITIEAKSRLIGKRSYTLSNFGIENSLVEC